MARVFSENRSLLTRYLAAVGCSRWAAFTIITDLENEEAVIEMLEFCADNPNATQEELLSASSKIAARLNREEEMEETEETEE